MKKLTVLFTPIILLALSPFETPKEKGFDLSVFDTKRTIENIKAMKNKTVTCRYVCDKKIYKEQKIADAISFYKSETKWLSQTYQDNADRLYKKHLHYLEDDLVTPQVFRHQLDKKA